MKASQLARRTGTQKRAAKTRISPNRQSTTGNCNICGSIFRLANPFQRFCQSCRNESELYRLSEWLPVSTCWA
jgi:hypothetical protein